MKISSWIRRSRNPIEESNTSNPQQKPNHHSCKEEFSDRLNSLLAIGTFGNSNLKQSRVEADNTNAQELEEVGRELRLLLNSKHITVDQLLECLCNDGDSDTWLKRKSRDISKKSLSFLIKKALLCGGGFDNAPPLPILKDPVKQDLSRMEKILRAMLHKKVYPQTQRHAPKKYLDMPESEEEEDDHGSKWVKTDSEYIVLEI